MTVFKKNTIILFVLFITTFPLYSQTLRDDNQREISKDNVHNDKTKSQKKIKTGIRSWTINDQSGLTDSVVVDTTSHLFQNTSYTDGLKGFYNNLGNIGSPRLSKIFSLRPEMNNYIFIQPYDFFVKDINTFHFTNTYSPITNVTYHECGNSDNGEDHLIAKYAININKDAGIGFNIDYIYGRGFHDNQSTADFGFNLYGSVIKPRYKAHWLMFADYLKTHENGGITDDEYVKNPQKFPTDYTPKEIPTALDKVWNKIHVNGIQFNQRFSFGYSKKTNYKTDSIKTQNTDSLNKRGSAKPLGAISARIIENKTKEHYTNNTNKEKEGDSTVFIPISSVIHTLKIGANSRKFLANQSLKDYYTYNYLSNDSVSEHTDNASVSNYLALELSEGLNKYISAGIRLYAQHEFNNYKMPGLKSRDNFTENRFSVGAQIFRQNSSLLNYLLSAQTSSDGSSWGEYELRGSGTLKLALFNDSVSLSLRASSLNRKPTFFYRHYQSTYLWWNNSNLSKQLSNNIGGTLESKRMKLRLRADAYNITNYTYFATSVQSSQTSTDKPTLNTIVSQSTKSISVFEVAIDKNFNYGIFYLDNSLIWQNSTDKQALPLPTLTAYSNLYIKFRIAKVLQTEIGVDLKYFSKYYAPTYSVALGQYAIQSIEDRVKIGDHPVISAYVNFHLKHTRFYLMASHINYNKEGGTTFGAPHYPINPMVIRFGLSWNFFN